MSLQSVVLEIAEEMEAGGPPGSVLSWTGSESVQVRSWAKMLRMAVKASESPTDATVPVITHKTFESKIAEMSANKEDSKGPYAAFCVGGPADGDTAPVPGEAPEGAWFPIEDAIYQLNKGKLVYSEEQTKRLSQR